MTESPAKPDWVGPLVKRFYPSRFRIVWSESEECREWLFGERVPKYGIGRDRWMLEKWCPPTETRDQWDAAMEEALGPYPENGTWEHCFTFEVPVDEGCAPQFMPLEAGFVELVLRAIEAGKLRHTDAERKAALRERQEMIERRRHQLFDDIWDDSKPAPGAKIPDHIQRLDSFSNQTLTTASVPKQFQKRGLSQIGTTDGNSDSSTIVH